MNRKNPSQQKPLKNLIFVGIVTLLILLLPFAIRLLQHQPLLIGAESAHTLSSLKSPGINYSGIFLMLLSIIPTPDTAKLFLPVLFGTVAAILFFSMARRYFTEKFALLSSALLITAPLFIRVFTELSTFFFELMLLLIACQLAVSKKKWWSWLILAVVVLQDPWLGFSGGLIVIYLMPVDTYSPPAASFSGKLSKKTANAFLIKIIALAAIAAFSLFFQNEKPVMPDFSISGSLSDLAGVHGLSVPLIFLGFTGALLFWSKKQSNPALMLLFAGMLFSFAWVPLRVVLLPFFSVFAAEGLMFLAARKWSFAYMKQVTLLLIGCTIFFSGSTFISLLVQQEPSALLRESLSSMKGQLQQLSPNTKILVRPEIGSFVEYYSGYDAVVDLHEQQRGNDVWEQGRKALLSRNYKATELLLEQAGTYLFMLDPALKKDIEEHGKGVLFLMGVTPYFEKKYSMNGIEAYLFVPPESNENNSGSNATG